ARNIFPLGFRWQAVTLAGRGREPIDIGLRIVMRHAKRRMVARLVEARIAPAAALELLPLVVAPDAPARWPDIVLGCGDEGSVLIARHWRAAHPEPVSDGHLMLWRGQPTRRRRHLLALFLRRAGTHDERSR